MWNNWNSHILLGMPNDMDTLHNTLQNSSVFTQEKCKPIVTYLRMFLVTIHKCKKKLKITHMSVH